MNIRQLSQHLNLSTNERNKKNEREEVFFDESKSSAYKLSISDYGMEYIKRNQEIKIALINKDIESYNEDFSLKSKGK